MMLLLLYTKMTHAHTLRLWWAQEKIVVYKEARKKEGDKEVKSDYSVLPQAQTQSSAHQLKKQTENRHCQWH